MVLGSVSFHFFVAIVNCYLICNPTTLSRRKILCSSAQVILLAHASECDNRIHLEKRGPWKREISIAKYEEESNFTLKYYTCGEVQKNTWTNSEENTRKPLEKSEYKFFLKVSGTIIVYERKTHAGGAIETRK